MTLEAVQKMLQKQKDEINLELQEDLNRSHLEIIAEQREMNKQLMDGLVNNLGQTSQASLTGGNVKLPSIENKTESSIITEMPSHPKDERDKEKRKHVLKSNVLIKASTSTSMEGRDVNKERDRILSEREEEGFSQEEIDLIPNMSTPLKRDVRDEPHPNWLNTQTTRSP